jgi:hypothetical protein
MQLRLVYDDRGPLLSFAPVALVLFLCTGCHAFPSANRLTEATSSGNSLPNVSTTPASTTTSSVAQQWSESWHAWWQPERSTWKIWGEENLQTGDLVFTRGNYYMLLGAINFTDLATKMCQAEFSHVGIVVVEDNRPMVYDISDAGIEATPFEAYVTRQGYQQVAVRRPHDAIYPSLPQCVDYLRQQRQNKVRFDRKFLLGNQQLYCTELIYEAFNEAGIVLCQPVPVGELPGKDDILPATMFMAKQYTGLNDDTQLICIGNESYGIYGSPLFSQLLEATPVKSPPHPSQSR